MGIATAHFSLYFSVWTAHFSLHFMRVSAHFSVLLGICNGYVVGVRAFMFLRFKIVSVGATMAHI